MSRKILWYLWRSCGRIGTTFMVWSRSRWKTEFDKTLQSPYCKSFDTEQFEISFVKKNVKVRAEVTYWISDCFASYQFRHDITEGKAFLKPFLHSVGHLYLVIKDFCIFCNPESCYAFLQMLPRNRSIIFARVGHETTY